MYVYYCIYILYGLLYYCMYTLWLVIIKKMVSLCVHTIMFSIVMFCVCLINTLGA